MVATTRSRSCRSCTRTLRPRLSKPAAAGEHAKLTTTRAASAAASAKKEKDEDIFDKRSTPPRSKSADDNVLVKKERDEDIFDKRSTPPRSKCADDNVLAKKEKDEDIFDERSTPPRSKSADDNVLARKENAPDGHCIKRLDTAQSHGGKREVRNEEEATPFSTAACHYESLKLQRIAENKARLAALGVQQHVETLTSFFMVSKPVKRAWKKSPVTPIEQRRRSDRLKNVSPSPGLSLPYNSDSDLDSLEETIVVSAKRRLVWKERVKKSHQDDETPRPANAPLPKNCPANLQVSPILSAIRCRSKERGTVYDSIVGICCHFCRQKTLCSEEDCERCSQRDVTKTCLGKTDCSKCHSNMGVFCRACLKIRYGEELEEVRQQTDWLCPHCSEEQGLNPYWICNSSICLTRRKIAPTGIAIYKARELGFKSVAHYLADLLEKKARI